MEEPHLLPIELSTSEGFRGTLCLGRIRILDENKSEWKRSAFKN
jgi:hypothetical protein